MGGRCWSIEALDTHCVFVAQSPATAKHQHRAAHPCGGRIVCNKPPNGGFLHCSNDLRRIRMTAERHRKLLMAAAKGTRPPNAGKGRPKGVPNKVTQEFRETVQSLLDHNKDNVQRWLTLVAEGDGTDKGAPDPGKALDLLAKLAEFAAPKLARTELTGANGGPVRVIAGPLDESI